MQVAQDHQVPGFPPVQLCDNGAGVEAPVRAWADVSAANGVELDGCCSVLTLQPVAVTLAGEGDFRRWIQAQHAHLMASQRKAAGLPGCGEACSGVETVVVDESQPQAMTAEQALGDLALGACRLLCCWAALALEQRVDQLGFCAAAACVGQTAEGQPLLGVERLAVLEVVEQPTELAGEGAQGISDH